MTAAIIGAAVVIFLFAALYLRDRWQEQDKVAEIIVRPVKSTQIWRVSGGKRPLSPNEQDEEA